MRGGICPPAKAVSPNSPPFPDFRALIKYTEDSKMKKSHIAVIALSVSIAFLALFVGSSEPDTVTDGAGEYVVAVE